MAFEARGLAKSYGGVPVLRGVDLAVADGEIHALLGANGAGKSTLIKCVSGAITPDSGVMSIGGREFASLTPRHAQEAGVAVIYQELSLAKTLSVNDNIFLGDELRSGPFVRRRAQRRESSRLLSRLSASIDPDDSVERLSGADQQVVEIAKAMRRRAGLLILDEPTAALTEAETVVLMSQLRGLKRDGLPMLYVTHRLAEVFEIADRVTVLRDGSIVLTGAVGDVTRADLVNAIAGGSASSRAKPPRVATVGETPHLQLRGVVAPGVGPVDLDVRAGEIVALFGLLGSGRTELLEMVAGATRAAAGQISVDGSRVSFKRPADAIAKGIALVPAERLQKSLFAPLTSLENVLLPVMPQLSRVGFRNQRREREAFSSITASLRLSPPRIDLAGGRFSGGNQQKLVLARWLGTSTRLLLLDEPTQGVDVGAREDLYAAVRAAASERGLSVLFASSDEEEVESLASRAVVMAKGNVVAQLEGSEIRAKRLVEFAHLGEEPADPPSVSGGPQ